MLKDKIEERKRTLDAAGAILTAAAARSVEKRSLTPEETQEFEKRHTDGDAMLAEIGRFEKQLGVEKQMSEIRSDPRPAGREDVTREGGATTTDEDRKAKDREYRGVYRQWMTAGDNGLTQEQRSLLSTSLYVTNPNDPKELELRALSASTGSAGAYTVPQGFQYTLDIALKAYGGMLENASFVDTDQGNDLPWPTFNDTANSGENLAENAAATETQDPSFGVITLRAYMKDSGIILVPVQLLQDSAFDPETFLSDAARTRLGRRVNNLATVGTGTNDMTGLLVAATSGVIAASTSAIAYNELLDLEHSVDPAYRPNAKFMYNDSTLKLLKKLTDGNGRPLWIAGGTAEGVQNRRPDTVDGFPYVINQDMPSVATGQKTVTFGDLSKYKIRRVRQAQMVRFGERFMDKLQIGFMLYQRFDGNLIDSGQHPVRYLVHP
jgi:HK97 family phage major capsid protein